MLQSKREELCNLSPPGVFWQLGVIGTCLFQHCSEHSATGTRMRFLLRILLPYAFAKSLWQEVRKRGRITGCGCDGLNESVPHRLRCLCAWSPVGGAVKV